MYIQNSEEIIFSISDSVNDGSQGVSLRLLNIIERTVSNLAKSQDTLSNLIRLVESITPSDEHQNDSMIDPEDRVEEKLLSTQSLLEERITLLQGKCDSAKEDPELVNGHEENVVMEFERTIDCMASLFNAVGTLRVRIAEHDSNLDEVEGTFTDAKALIASMSD